MLLGKDGIAGPQHSVLHAEGEQGDQRRLFITGRKRLNSKAGGQFSLELLRAPQPAGRIHEIFEGP